MTKAIKLYSKVKLKNGKGRKSLTIVKPDEIDLSEGKISFESPLGKALMDRKSGETVEVETPSGIVKYKVISIS